jgi:hypothetical protein
MHLLPLAIAIALLLPFPVLYPPIASLTAFFVARQHRAPKHRAPNHHPDAIALFLVISAAVVTSLVSATITPVSDTQNYVDFFNDIRFFDFSELGLTNEIEPLYTVYVYITYFITHGNERLFLLTTALIFNLLSAIAILRICGRLGHPEFAHLILTVYYSLVSPAFGQPLFLLRSSLSLAVLLFAMSFRYQSNAVFYILSTISIFIHFTSLLVFGIFTFWQQIDVFNIRHRGMVAALGQQSQNKKTGLKIHLLLLLFALLVVTTMPNLVLPVLQSILGNLANNDAIGGGKAKSFIDAGDANFLDFSNPVMILHLGMALLCFLNIRTHSRDLSQPSDLSKPRPSAPFTLAERAAPDLLQALRATGRFLLTIIICTAPLNVLPLRLGLFEFLYFPLWLINIPFLLETRVKKLTAYLPAFSSFLVLVYSLYWVPKRGIDEYFIVVLNGKPFDHSLTQIIEYFL